MGKQAADKRVERRAADELVDRRAADELVERRSADGLVGRRAADELVERREVSTSVETASESPWSENSKTSFGESEGEKMKTTYIQKISLDLREIVPGRTPTSHSPVHLG